MYCKHCGKQIADDSKFCAACGKPVDNVNVIERQSSRKKFAWWQFVLGAFVAVLLLFLLVKMPKGIQNNITADTTISDTSLSVIADSSSSVLLDTTKIDSTSIAKTKVQEPKAAVSVPAGFVDLGLPSGTLWKKQNETGGFYTYDEAIAIYGKKLPTMEQWNELVSECKWVLSGNICKGTGPNGKTIVLPAKGCIGYQGGTYKEGSYAVYWSSTPDGQDNAWYVNFITEKGNDGILFFHDKRSFGYSVRLVYK